MAIDPNIKKKADDIRNKVYGKEVRESLASGLEEMSSDVVENEGRQSVVESRQDSVESQWQAVSDEMTDKDVISAPEIIAARNGEANLKTRIDKDHQEVTAQLAQTGEQTTNVYNAGVKTAYSAKKGKPEAKVVFCDDDGAREVMTELVPFAHEKGIPFTLALTTESPILADNAEELRELQNDYGWEMAAHTRYSLQEYTEDEIRELFTEINNKLRAEGFEVNNHIYANGYYDDTVQRVASEYYRSGSSTGETYPNDPEDMKMFQLMRSATPSYSYENRLDDLKSRVDHAESIGGLLIFTAHIWNMNEGHLEELGELVDYIKNKGIEITTLNKALDDFAPVVQSGYVGDEEYAQITRDGKLLSNRAKTKLVAPNTFKVGDSIEKYEEDMVTICEISGENTTGFPNNARGTLITLHTFNLGTQRFSYSHQIFKQHWSHKIYIRYPSSLTVWAPWHEIATSERGFHKVETQNKYTAQTPISEFPDGITTNTITTNNADGTPFNRPGVLTTYKTQGNGYDRQTFHRYDYNEQFVRHLKTDGNWSEWTRVANTTAGSQRPNSASVGDYHFDSSLGKPVWLKTLPNTWVDANGQTV